MTKSKFIIQTSVALLMLLVAASLCPAAEDMGLITGGDKGEALAELKAGRIDAMFYVAGYPVKLLKEDFSEKDGLELIPITNKSIIEFYPRADIPANVYEWQKTPVNTVAVKAVLVSFDFRRKDCDNVGRFAQTMSRQMNWLLQNGHPKWKVVDLNYPVFNAIKGLLDE